MVPAYHIKEGTIPHPAVCKHRMQYDWRPEWSFEVRVWMWNIGSLSGKGGEGCEELRKRMADGTLQEVRWSGHGSNMFGM